MYAWLTVVLIFSTVGLLIHGISSANADSVKAKANKR
jgi:hypothetical protein